MPLASTAQSVPSLHCTPYHAYVNTLHLIIGNSTESSHAKSAQQGLQGKDTGPKTQHWGRLF